MRVIDGSDDPAILPGILRLTDHSPLCGFLSAFSPSFLHQVGQSLSTLRGEASTLLAGGFRLLDITVGGSVWRKSFQGRQDL